MIGKRSEFLMSEAEKRKKASAKWQSVKLVLMTSAVIIASIAVSLLPLAFRRVQPTAEFVFLVVAPGVWNSVCTWITAPRLYVLLNILLVTLAFISRAAPPTSNDDRSHNSAIICRLTAEVESIQTRSDALIDHNNIIVESKLADPVEKKLSSAASQGQAQKPAAALIVEGRSRSFKDLKATLMPAPALYKKESSLRRSTLKLSNLSKESRESREMTITEPCIPASPKKSAPSLVVFEISTDHVEDYYTYQAQLHVGDEVPKVEGDEETKISHCEEGMPLSSDELYVKAESFIGNFYRQLKMQREDSWNRLCGIYKRSS